jgi:hypothetical protein
MYARHERDVNPNFSPDFHCAASLGNLVRNSG